MKMEEVEACLQQLGACFAALDEQLATPPSLDAAALRRREAALAAYRRLWGGVLEIQRDPARRGLPVAVHKSEHGHAAALSLPFGAASLTARPLPSFEAAREALPAGAFAHVAGHVVFRAGPLLLHAGAARVYDGRPLIKSDGRPELPTRVLPCCRADCRAAAKRQSCKFYHDPAEFPGARDVRNFHVESWSALRRRLYCGAQPPLSPIELGIFLDQIALDVLTASTLSPAAVAAKLCERWRDQRREAPPDVVE
jgi:hypothetical protein